MSARLLLALVLLAGCGGGVEDGAPVPCSIVDAGPVEAAALVDAPAREDAASEDASPRDPAVCVSPIGGVDGGGVVATCDAPGAFSWVDVTGLVFDCRAAPCPRGAPCRVNGRLEWEGVCR